MIGLNGLSSYSSFFGSSGNNSMSTFYSNLSQYGSIRNSSYAKATKAYYKKIASEEKEVTTGKEYRKDRYSTKKKPNTIDKTSDTYVELSNVKAKATKLKESADKLTDTGKNTLFAENKPVDTEAVLKAVKEFASNYNDTKKVLHATSNSAVKSIENSMTKMTDVMKKSLDKVGVTVGDDGKLAVDEEKLKNADMKQVKSLFNGSGSYAGIISSTASRAISQASNQMNQTSGNLYGSNGYYNNYNNFSFFNSYV